MLILTSAGRGFENKLPFLVLMLPGFIPANWRATIASFTAL